MCALLLHMPLQSGSDKVLKGCVVLTGRSLFYEDSGRSSWLPRPRLRPTLLLASLEKLGKVLQQTLDLVEKSTVYERIYVPVLAASRDARRDDGGSGTEGRGAGSV